MTLRIVLMVVWAAMLAGSGAELRAQPLLRIDAIESQGSPVAETTDVRLTRLALARRIPKIEVGMKLSSSDLLESVSGKTLVKISCIRGTFVHLSGKFRVMVSATPNRCVINLLGGKLHMSAKQPTEVRLAGVIAGSQGTRYEIEVLPEGAAFVVFEDEIQLTLFESQQSRTLGEGAKVVYGQGVFQDFPIVTEDYNQAADLVARLDVAEATVRSGFKADPPLSGGLEDLRASYERVFRAPGDSEAWSRLVLARHRLEGRTGPPEEAIQRRSDAEAEVPVADVMGRVTKAFSSRWLSRSGHEWESVDEGKSSSREFEPPSGDPAAASSQQACAAASLYLLMGLPDLAASVAREGLTRFEQGGDLAFTDFLECFEIAHGAAPSKSP